MRAPLHALVRGSAAVFGVDALGKALTLGVHLLLARRLTGEAYGLFALALSWLAVLALLSGLGTGASLVRFVAEYRVRQEWKLLRGVVRRARQIAAVAAVLMGLLVWLAIDLLGLRGATGTTFRWVAVLLPLVALAETQTSIMRGLRRVATGTIPMLVLRPVVMVAGVLLLVRLGDHRLVAADALALHGLSVAVALACLFTLVRACLPAEYRGAGLAFETVHWLRVSLPLFLVSGMRVLLTNVDIVLVGALLGPLEAGVYGVASRVAQLTAFGLTATNAAVAPLIAEQHSKESGVNLQRLGATASRIALASSLLIGGTLVVARGAILEVFGEDYRAGSAALVILVCGQIVNAVCGPVGPVLNMTGHQDQTAKILGCITLANAVLNVPAILLLGIEGAALVTGGLLALRAVWYWMAVRRALQIDVSVFGSSGARP